MERGERLASLPPPNLWSLAELECFALPLWVSAMSGGMAALNLEIQLNNQLWPKRQVGPPDFKDITSCCDL